MKKLLFVCTENKLRSATAEYVFSELDGYDAIGAGTNSDAETPLSGDLIEWADVVFAMESIHKKKVSNKYRDLLNGKRLVVLGIPDNYKYMQRELVELLKSRVLKHFQ